MLSSSTISNDGVFCRLRYAKKAIETTSPPKLEYNVVCKFNEQKNGRTYKTSEVMGFSPTNKFAVKSEREKGE